ncbi:MAG: ATP-binding protein [Caldilineaceae bacterium]
MQYFEQDLSPASLEEDPSLGQDDGGDPLSSPPEIEQVDQALLQQALAQFVNDALPSIAFGLGGLYIVFGIAHYLLLPLSFKWIMVGSAVTSSLFLIALAAHLHKYPVRDYRAHLGAFVIAGVVLVNSWLHLWFTGDPLQSSNFMLLQVGIGFFFLSTTWFVIFSAGLFLSWATAFVLLNIPAVESTHFAFGLCSAALMGALAHRARKRALSRLTQLRISDERRARDLRAALTAERQIEVALRRSEAGYRQLSIQLEEQAESLRVANNKLAHAARLKDEFLASMSHELRTPLTAILGLTESLREQIYGTLSDRQQTALFNIQESGQHLLDLINDILDVAKTESGQLALELTPADARLLAEVSLRFCRPEAEKKSLSVNFDYDARVTLLLADERRLKQILVNLLSNALKFTVDGGAIGLRVAGDVENEIVRYTVWDTGIGIAEEQMSQLFKPFIQLDSRLSRRYAGSGLGLVLAYRMAKMHGGSISLTSRQGEGSEFTIAIPWRKISLPPNPTATATLPSQTIPQNGVTGGKRSTLLIIDEQAQSRAWMTLLIKPLDYDLLFATNGSDAVQFALAAHPALIFIDSQIASNEGISLIRVLAKDSRLQQIPLIAISALILPGEAEQMQTEGAAAYIAKPVGRNDLQALLHRYSLRATPAADA